MFVVKVVWDDLLTIMKEKRWGRCGSKGSA